MKSKFDNANGFVILTLQAKFNILYNTRIVRKRKKLKKLKKKIKQKRKENN